MKNLFFRVSSAVNFVTLLLIMKKFFIGGALAVLSLIAPIFPAHAVDLCSNENIAAKIALAAVTPQPEWGAQATLQYWAAEIQNLGFIKGRYAGGIVVKACVAKADGTHYLHLYHMRTRQHLHINIRLKRW